ncbi:MULTISPECIES: LPD28 domain-containing protein [unclassified Breznakia]|uniref:LPD28 domain-containing protein n=1 Tax=unclassified Breznakia TaxID=2623764 RepID=UPI0024770447|nr:MULTISPECIES: LPD28 domain-containing protein [unclassified Breznakia]MDH6367852.1 hypothetical protein [Breznakia sp. PH1-1]MDH6404940.1 hypothetical protein [Breznakia sp. PF1-11]MDH6412655.1 hypothetical protein [Breznakia sp. PFB1-11]MDH6415042.1 hypothetical protein [Breznakia sp. PFB1-14]MDH6417326.1 hypothetical protein [Breznakia sp. PFB1-4]
MIRYAETGGRIPVKDRKPELFYFELRSWDEGRGETIELGVWVNHMGTIVSDTDLLALAGTEIIEDADKFFNEHDFVCDNSLLDNELE